MAVRAMTALLLLESGSFGAMHGALAAEYVSGADSYMGADFFSRWDFFQQPDPTHGIVEYVDEGTATARGLIHASADRIYIGSDAGGGSSGGASRGSIRIESKEAFNAGLFVITLDHIPTGCGTWPAFWMFGHGDGHDWPVWGEFDLIEGVHRASKVSTTLHTSEGCDQSRLVPGQDFAGGWNMGPSKAQAATNCYVQAPGQFYDQGCSQHGPEGSFGASFNAEGGGTFAAEWDPIGQRIRTWFWPRGAEPLDLVNKRPVPDAWGQPYSFFSLADEDCPTRHFINMHMIFDLTFCGDLGNAMFESGCPAIAAQMTCESWVQSHPAAMSEAFWSIRAFDTYQPRIPPPVLYGPPTADWWMVFMASVTPLALLSVVMLFGIQRAHDPTAEFSLGSVCAAVMHSWESLKRGGLQVHCARAADFVAELASQLVRRLSISESCWDQLPTDGMLEGRMSRQTSPILSAFQPGDPVVARDAFVTSGRWTGTATVKAATYGIIESIQPDGSANVRFDGGWGAMHVTKEQLANLEAPPRRSLWKGGPSSLLASLAEYQARATEGFMALHPHWRWLIGGILTFLVLASLLLMLTGRRP